MEKPITVSFRWTAKEMLLAQGLHMRYSVRAHRVPEGFLLYPSERMFHWLPMHGFQEAAV
jgi:hypothetical protein